MKRCCIIVAGGNGSRMGAEVPKQFLRIGTIPVLMHTIRNFSEFDPALKLIVVLPENEIDSWEAMCVALNFEINHQVVAGGKTRFQSVKNGLTLAKECDIIAIHDGVRPLVSHETLSRCFNGAGKWGSAIPVLPSTESIRKGDMGHSVPVDRSHYFMVQTPQVFRKEIIMKGYQQEWDPGFTDDASVAESSGSAVHLVLGNRENIKITFPEDLLLAGLLLKSKSGNQE